MQRAFILLWTATAIIVIALMVLLYVSLLPHFTDIGDWFVWVLRLGMICGAALMLVATWAYINILLSRMRRARNHENMVSAPAEQHSIYLQETQPRFSIHEVSANVVAASVPRMLPAPKDEPPLEATDETIVEMWADGQMTLERIAEQLKISYYRVQRVTSEAKKRGVVRK